MSECPDCDITMIPQGEYQICPVCGDHRAADPAWRIPGEFDDDPPTRPTWTGGAQRRTGPLRGMGWASGRLPWRGAPMGRL